MDKLMDQNQVRKAYQKYMVKFHPDKIIPSGDSEKIYIANEVNAAMLEAWNVFKKENGISWYHFGWDKHLEQSSLNLIYV